MVRTCRVSRSKTSRKTCTRSSSGKAKQTSAVWPRKSWPRIQRSFDLDDRFSTDPVNRLIDEAVKSGPESPLTRKGFDAARQKAQTQFAAKHKAA